MINLTEKKIVELARFAGLVLNQRFMPKGEDLDVEYTVADTALGVDAVVMFAVVSILPGDIFRRDNRDIMMKLTNPARPALSKVSDWSVWAADIGNGEIIQLDPQEKVTVIGRVYDLIFFAERGS